MSKDNNFPFFEELRAFYVKNRNKIRRRYKDITKKFLDYNDKNIRPDAFLRTPQFEALEMYVFLKEAMNNAQVYDIFSDWYNNLGDFSDETWFKTESSGQLSLIDMEAADYKDIFDYMHKNSAKYANYIFALTMGLGKTILMTTCIFYEFLLSMKYPKDERFCHNALVFAPDKTVLESLREIITFDKSKVIPKEYLGVLEANVKFHFLDETGITLNTLDGSDYNIIISNTQKIIRKFIHKEKSPLEKLMDMPSNIDDSSEIELIDTLYGDLSEISNEVELRTNQRYEKLTRLKQLGVYVDEAHHMFGKDLQKSISSLRQTINDLNDALEENKTNLVACYNFTGTPYVDNSILPDVVYYYGLKMAIHNNYLKDLDALGYTNVKSHEFLKYIIHDFWDKYGNNTYEGLLPKIAIFGATVNEVVNEIKPIVEETIVELGLPLSKILVNVGDSTITKDNDIKDFNNLDVLGTNGSEKQFILLCGKGREGWNCRSLFSVAMFRSPKSKVFVLQATMRCLRQITKNQQTATIYLSNDNYNILDNELNKNFRVSIKDLKRPNKDKEVCHVHIIKDKTLKFKFIEKRYSAQAREYHEPITFDLLNVDLEYYKSYVREKPSLTDDRMETKTEIDNIKENISYSPIMLVSEIARYLNISCLKIQQILEESDEGIDMILQYVSKYNEILYDVIIPKIFAALNDIKCEIRSIDREVPLLKLPDDSNEFIFNATKGLVINVEEDQFNKVKGKSFHADNYCFDSESEHQCFLQYIFNNKVKEIYFTGMFTSQYNGLCIKYIDPETNEMRTYYPDFISKLDDGTIEIIEVKGDNKIDDAVVLAKAEAAKLMATESNMKYRLISSSEIGSKLVI